VRAHFTLVVTTLLWLSTAGVSQSEPIGSHFELTPMAGYTLFDGDLKGVFGQPLTDDLYLGGRLSYHFHRWFAIEAAGGFTPTTLDPNGDDIDFFHAAGDLMLTPFAGRYGGPYLFGGGGTAQVKPSSGGSETNGALEVGGGIRFWLTDMVGLRLESRQIYFEKDGAKINNLVFGAGLTLALGARPRDTDGDGVPDTKDRCPDTPKGATVDASGCPKDSDGDQVWDGIDQCADTPKGATVDARGCPSDADGDGVYDGIDQCADTPKGATVDAKGCTSDSDADGVLDGLDQCEGTPSGCQVDEKGCPKDADGDGVCDGRDQCTDTGPGLKVDEKGCPIEVLEKETELLDTGMIRLENVNFETGKSEIKPESHAVLDVVGQVLSKWPELKIEIGGHTDSRGSAGFNQRLSEARADAVRSYLAQKFPDLKVGQFSVRGYGESRPVVPNTNPDNMARNRRVEFVVQNKDVLRREIERRRLLKQGEETPAPSPTPAPPDTSGGN
jgi:outer membrane protein OmpA-like peptidoglycan-associated protein